MNHFDPGVIGPAQSAAVADIVVQCLRNAVVHGLEPPDDRQRLGKPPQGTITLALYGDQTRTRLMVRDDGRGIDLEAVKIKARRSGLVSDEQSAAWTSSQWVSLLFRPGFSTAPTVGLHAGRGVGLDLIKHRLEEIGGKVRVGFRQGQFTEFHFTFARDLPLAKTA